MAVEAGTPPPGGRLPAAKEDGMWEGRVSAVYIGPRAAEPMQAVDEVRAVAGVGLEGDRYAAKEGSFSGRPDPAREITLIESEAVEAVRAGGLQIDAADTRRNIVTTGVPLNHLVGCRVRVGDAVVEGIRLCEPCSHLAKLTGRELVQPLLHRAGLRARVVTTGVIRVGDVVREDAAPGA